MKLFIKIIPLVFLLYISFIYAYDIEINQYTENKLDYILEKKKDYNSQEELIEFISGAFLNTPYQANTLHGSNSLKEKLVIKFDGVDCFTYIDYVEALKQASNKKDFIQKLIKVRYINEEVAYLKRKHFFSDWYEEYNVVANDITNKISPKYKTVFKFLNKKEDGNEYIPTLGVKNRIITYIPSENIDQAAIDNMKTGDYIGIYTNLAGLDVTHTGILIKNSKGVFYRNASSLSKNNKVVDTPLLEYINGKPGIVVLRPIE